MRHAQTLSNLQSRYMGSTDEPLAPEGIATARARRPDASVATVHTSALARTRQTAAIVYPNAEIVVHPGLNEMDFGIFEGKTQRELDEMPEYAEWLASKCEAPCPGGESMEEFAKRSRGAFSAVLAASREKGETEIRFVVHGGVIMALMSGFVDPDRDYFTWHAGHCGGYVIQGDVGNQVPFTLLETFGPPDESADS